MANTRADWLRFGAFLSLPGVARRLHWPVATRLSPLATRHTPRPARRLPTRRELASFSRPNRPWFVL